jgi:hypothetical protein
MNINLLKDEDFIKMTKEYLKKAYSQSFIDRVLQYNIEVCRKKSFKTGIIRTKMFTGGGFFTLSFNGINVKHSGRYSRHRKFDTKEIYKH